MIKDFAYFSEQGIRSLNQDSIYASVCEGRGIFAVADGMGGHTGGEIASGAIVNGIKNWWRSNEFAKTNESAESVAEMCQTLLKNINSEVYQFFYEKGQTGGSTAAVLILWDGQYEILSAGDSRIYHVEGEKLKQLTTDDVWENLPDVRYGMPNEAVAADSRYGKLTEALGSDEKLNICRVEGMLKEKEWFLLCSDGVYKSCPHDELEKIMCGGILKHSAEKKKKLIKKCALKYRTDDNYSAILCFATTK